MYIIPSKQDALAKSDVLDTGKSLLSNSLLTGNVLAVGVFSSETIIILSLIKCSQVSKK